MTFQPITTFEEAAVSDTTVNACIHAQRDLKAIIVELVNDKRRLMNGVIELDRIAPRKITAPDDQVYVWRCPDHLTPEVTNQ